MTRVVKIGRIKIGGENPVVVKGMLKTSLEDRAGLCKEARDLAQEGAEIIRVAIMKERDCSLLRDLRRVAPVSFEADIHFNYLLAMRALESGFDAIRLNPLNIFKKKEVKEIVRLAKEKRIPIRVGINSGGFIRNFSSPRTMAKAMVRKVVSYINWMEEEGFFDIMVSLKASDIETTIIANELFSARYKYPLHLGITATGFVEQGIVKSSLGIGLLLREGIGHALRVSLTANSQLEVRIAKYILQSLNIRSFTPEIISCPQCSRCEVDIEKIVGDFVKKLYQEKIFTPLKIAIMGCVVNGPGEAFQADIGVAFGKNRAAIFRKDKIIGYTNRECVIKDLLKEVRRYGLA